MHLFYTPDLSGLNYTLDETESKHCTRVLRLTNKDIVHLIDGKGGFHKAEIIDPNPKRCTVQIIESIKDVGKRNHYLHIAIAPTKNMDRFEWFIEKATEIGIDEITPLLCEHSERKVIKTDRLEKIIIAAMKQSKKAYKPQINGMTEIRQFLSQNFNGDKFIAHCEDYQKNQLKTIYNKGNNALILIGPEGDFSPEEIQLSKDNAFIEISLGDSRLRTETAGIVACHTINLLNN
ncbi:MAG: 16S rRNA (uracil(1498)-N(3))-methyltransferase [Bacteroidetes bacterium GWF2_33_16]|nr:MAG: 16S rRNA (uracil(1498)-N(3))-methyltransferase [Bacteroidetes bacterium GWE2_32_14]OFY07292.1 MAG: 16S rRNA (uracil(1498)-N(3))-methyltransferase [Bacteroidetes bacterium GWF2_33_16]